MRIANEERRQMHRYHPDDNGFNGMEVLGRERDVDFVFVMGLVELVQGGIDVHRLVRDVGCKVLDHHHQEQVPDDLSRRWPMAVVRLKEKGRVLLEDLSFDIYFESIKGWNNHAQVQRTEFQRSVDQLPDRLTDLWTGVKPRPANMLLDPVSFEKWKVTGVDR